MYLRIALVRSIVLSEVAGPGTTSTRGVSNGALPYGLGLSDAFIGLVQVS